MKHLHFYIAGLCCCGAVVPSYAQASDFERAFRSDALQARVGVTIPFGGDSKKAQSKPQFALGLRQETSRPKPHDWAMGPASEERDVREMKLSLTLEASPTFLMNGQALTFQTEGAAVDGTLNALDTYDKSVLTVIGVSLAVIAGTFLVLS